MSWDDWDDDEPRSRRRARRDDFDRHNAPPQSSAVTGAGVVTIVLGVLLLLCGVCNGILGLAFTGVGQLARQEGNVFPPGIFEFAGGFFLAIALLYMGLGVCSLIGGIGTLQRRRWGRSLTLMLGAASGLLALAHIGIVILIWSQGAGLFGAMQNDELVVQSFMIGVIALVFLGHMIFVYVVLLNAHNREEFD